MIQQPLYLSYKEMDTPRRFGETLRAYHSYLNRILGSYSLRNMSEDVGIVLYGEGGKLDVHGIVNNLIVPDAKTKRWSKPRPNTIAAIVTVINSKVTSDQQWPLAEAFEAAGYPRETGMLQAKIALATRNRRQEEIASKPDTMRPGVARLGSRIYDINRLATMGMAEATLNRMLFWHDTSMGIIVGRIPGYPLQRDDDDWVLCQENDHVPNEPCYALIRTSPSEVMAVPKDEAVGLRTPVICWLIAIMRFSVNPLNPDTLPAPDAYQS